VAALLLTPREEEPQIIVPMADVFVSAPGASAEEVEKLVADAAGNEAAGDRRRRVSVLRIAGGGGVVTVRFYVGEDREDSLVKVWNKLMSSRDSIPSIVSQWTVKPVEIDDVPIVYLHAVLQQPAHTIRRRCAGWR